MEREVVGILKRFTRNLNGREYTLYEHKEKVSTNKYVSKGLWKLSKNIKGVNCLFTDEKFLSFENAEELATQISDGLNETHFVHEEVIEGIVPKDLKELFNFIDFSEPVYFDIETTGLKRKIDKITSFQFTFTSIDGDIENCFIARGNFSDNGWETFFKAFKKAKLVCHNGKFDLLFIYDEFGVELALFKDTFVMAHVACEEGLGLKDIVLKYFNHDYDIKTSEKTGNITQKLKVYGILDTVYLRYVLEILENSIKELKVAKVLKYEYRAYLAYIEVEKTGVPVSPNRHKVKKELEKDIADLLVTLNGYSKEPINWNSTKQLSEFLFTKAGMGLKPIEKTSKGLGSTSVGHLANFVGNPFIDTYLDYKKQVKLLQFIESWEGFIVDNRMYPSFNLTASTGRTTSSNPNLQQVPQDKRIRGLIEAEEGRRIIECDLSQAELRVAAWLSKDETMIKAYTSGSDLHAQTLTAIYGTKEPKDAQEAKRRRTNAKITNFSLIYGSTPKSLVKYAKSWGVDIPLDEANRLHDMFFDSYPSLQDFYKKCIAIARNKGYIVSPTGRKRLLNGINSNSFKERSADERRSINTPVQGMASDLCITALADVVFSDELVKSKFKVLGSVHDAILIECDEDYSEFLGGEVKKIMENPSVLRDNNLKMTVPIVADVEVKERWGG